MKTILLFLLLTLSTLTSFGQYTVQSPYLTNPDIAIPYADSCASFWFNAYDPTYGGYYTNIDRIGDVITSWGLNKNTVTTSRDAYAFARAFMLTGNEAYLTHARRALDFMYAHAWDTVYGGWYGSIDRFGNPTNRTASKTAFDQHYALLGIAASFEATRDTIDWHWLMRGYDSNEIRLWDTTSSRFGYYDYGTYNWVTRSGKSFNATVDAITTHVLSLYLLTGEETYRVRLEKLADNILDHLVPSMSGLAIGFVEPYTTDWTWNNDPANYNTRTIMGHVLKTAWCLGRIQQLLPDTAYLPAAGALAGDVWQKGYDHDFGGPYKDYDRVTGQMFLYGQADSAKAWWQMEQAVTGGLMLYDLTGDSWYLQMADETLNFFMQYFVDHQYGEVYSDRTRRGSQIWGNEKGSNGKAAYHSTELGYYVYLYGNLLLHGRPVTLHYRFSPSATERTISMNPLEYSTGKYRIRQVLRNGGEYTDFVAQARTLHLPAGIGGHFTVTYEPSVPTAVASDVTPERFSLSQNYPNPFNPRTSIRFTITHTEQVTLKIFNILGQEVATLVNETLPAGTYSRSWDATGVPSGMYFYRLDGSGSTDAGSGETSMKKMILLK
jgi:mannose/cellobiose epimerase-like protein (N-acyl-D-glucosamine 2-epimerase family)